MNEMQCAWCQAEKKPATRENGLWEQQESHYICEDCLIQLLPKKLDENADRQDEKPDENERRRSERFPVFSPVYLMEAHSARPREMKAVILDVSSTGMKIIIPEQFDVGATIKLGFFAREIICKASARIIRIQPLDHSSYPWFEIGLKLVDIQQEKR